MLYLFVYTNFRLTHNPLNLIKELGKLTMQLTGFSCIDKQASNVRKRKYDKSFLQSDFTFKNCSGNKNPLCLICNEVLAMESMKPSKSKIHLELKHTSYANKPNECFDRLLRSLNKKNSFEKFMTFDEKYLLASYKILY